MNITPRVGLPGLDAMPVVDHFEKVRLDVQTYVDERSIRHFTDLTTQNEGDIMNILTGALKQCPYIGMEATITSPHHVSQKPEAMTTHGGTVASGTFRGTFRTLFFGIYGDDTDGTIVQRLGTMIQSSADIQTGDGRFYQRKIFTPLDDHVRISFVHPEMVN